MIEPDDAASLSSVGDADAGEPMKLPLGAPPDAWLRVGSQGLEKRLVDRFGRVDETLDAEIRDSM